MASNKLVLIISKTKSIVFSTNNSLSSRPQLNLVMNGVALRKWMAANVLLLNSDKTEMLVLGPKKQRDLLLKLTIILMGVQSSQIKL